MRSLYKLKKESARVNELLKAEAIELRLGTTKSLKRLEDCKGDLKAFSHWAELEFREYVRRKLEHHAGVSGSLINTGARLLGLSPATTKRYLEKLRTEGGPFSGLGDEVIINPNYQSREADAYWLNDEDVRD